MSDLRVTYYLGAGASVNAVPMVSEIQYFYQYFLTHLRKKIDNHTLQIPKQDKRNNLQVIDSLESITQNLKDHYTPDTYAKKLWLKNQFNELERLKTYLSMFFFWIETNSNLTVTDSAKNKVTKGGIDKRYDPFWATLLEKTADGKIFLPSRINIITWNYDTQFENTYSNFVGGLNYHQIRENLCLFPKPKDQEYITDASRIIKVNGCSRITFLDKYPTRVSPFDSANTKLGIEFYLELFTKQVLGQNLIERSPSINFAWEIDNTESQESLKEAKDIFSKTQILVIIGYSFPTFNRKVDKDLFLHLPPDCTVYYQAPKSDVHDLIDKLKSIKHLTNEVKPAVNLDQFHIPIEL